MVNKFNITDAWGIAFEHNHNAFDLLRKGHKDEKEYLRIQELVRIPEDSPEYGRSEHFHNIGKQKTALDSMFRFYSGAVILFQAAMEALINDVLENKRDKLSLTGVVIDKLIKKGKFAEKWREVMGSVNQSTDEFDEYHKNIYKKLRIPLIHPTKNGIADLDDLTFDNLYDGFKNGWETYSKLYDGLRIPHYTFGESHSWVAMCKMHKIPVI